MGSNSAVSAIASTSFQSSLYVLAVQVLLFALFWWKWALLFDVCSQSIRHGSLLG
jgi:hypothetical protein